MRLAREVFSANPLLRKGRALAQVVSRVREAPDVVGHRQQVRRACLLVSVISVRVGVVVGLELFAARVSLGFTRPRQRL